jgi:uncharacterized protein (DUF927 family)
VKKGEFEMSEITVTPAEALLERHWSIIPAHRNKLPMLETWKEYQSRQATEAELHAWLKLNPPAWAIVTGRISQRITLDFDGEDGRQTFEKLHIPAHRSTPSGGYHADFVHPGRRVATVSGRNKTALGAQWPGLDIRGDGGYVLFAGETDRGRYTWRRDPDPHPLEAMPENLREFLGLSGKPAAAPSPKEGTRGREDAGELIRRALKLIDLQGRNNSGFWLATQLRDNRYGYESALEAMQSYRSRCPPVNTKGQEEEYSESEMLATLKQAYDRPARGQWEKQNGQATSAKNTKPGTEKSEDEDQHFALLDEGVFHTHQEKDKAGDFRPVTIKVCSPLEVMAYARDPNSEAWGRLLKWPDADKKEHSWIVPMRMLVADDRPFRETLADGGLQIGSGPNKLLTQYVMSRRPQRRIVCIPYVGWLERHFVTPEWVIPAGSDVGYQSAGRGEQHYRTSGTLQEWQENVSKRCRGNSRLIFAESASFAGPLLRPLNVQGGGFHYRSFSSFGKSTAQWVAGSVWGGGGRLGWARTWSATKNAFESIAELHNDGCLILDEIQLMSARDLEETVYMLANGSGKGRETRNMTGRRTLQWLCMILSNGEIKLSDCVALTGKKIRGGAEIRMATIPADAGAGMGIFEKLPHDIKDPRIFAEALEAAARQYYGTAIQPFIQGVIGNWDRFIREGVEFIEDFIIRNLPAGSAPEVRRVLRRFALVAYAGEVAMELGITGWESGEATAAAVICFHAWIEERDGVEGTDIKNAMEQVREFLATQHARFRAAEPKEIYSKTGEPITVEERIPNQLGYWKHIKGEDLVYLIDPGKFHTEVCAGFHATDIAKQLDNKGLLVHRKGKIKHREEVTLPNGDKKRLWFYAVKARILEGEEDAEKE